MCDWKAFIVWSVLFSINKLTTTIMRKMVHTSVVLLCTYESISSILIEPSYSGILYS